MSLKTLRNSIVALTLTAVFLSPLCAQNKKTGKEEPTPEMPRSEMPGQPPREMPHRMPFRDFPDTKLLMGTVKSVNTETNVVVISDCDGSETKVHVNPITRIVPLPQLPPKPEDEKPEPGERKFATLSDVKSGSWVIVKNFNTDTKTAEAAIIGIFTESK